MNQTRLELLEAELYSRSLAEYVKAAWHIVEPATPLVWNWHIDAICQALEAVTRGEVRNLIINIPPRFMKSLLVSVFWPTWTWTHSPGKRWMFSSYSTDMALRDSLKSRNIILSDWYQRRWPLKLLEDQNTKAKFENEKTGFRVAIGVGGLATGEGGDFIVVDDPLKAQDADSDVIREATNNWWDSTMSTRGNDPTRVSRVIIMQRLHTQDLTGYVVDKMKEKGSEQYEQIIIPMEYESNRIITTLPIVDPRSEPGQLLWPDRFPQVEVDKLKISLGPRGYAGQEQQRPAPDTGLVFLKEWWAEKNRFDPDDFYRPENTIARFLSFDTGLKEKSTSDYTGLTVGELFADYTLRIVQVSKEKLEFPALATDMQRQIRRWDHDGKLQGVIIEDKASGTSAIQTLRKIEPKYAHLIYDFQPKGDKVYRARQASLWCERDCVFLPIPNLSSSWLFDFTENLYQFPAVAHDDDVDSFVQLILYLENLLAEGFRFRGGIT